MGNRLDNTLDKQFKDKFEHFESVPSTLVWNQISQQLDQAKPKRRFKLVWFAAASILMIGAAAVWFTRNNLDQGVIVAKRFSPQSAIPAQTSQVSDNQQKTAFLSVSSLHSSKKVAKTDQHVVHQQNEPAPLAVNPEIIEAKQVQEPPLAITDPVMSQPSIATNAIAVAAQPEILETVEEPVAAKHKTSSLGRLVNFVVSRIDSREDKLIEVSEEQGEGLKITGLNLGFVKMKTINTNK